MQRRKGETTEKGEKRTTEGVSLHCVIVISKSNFLCSDPPFILLHENDTVRV